MAVDNVRAEPKLWQAGKHRPAEECKLIDILENLVIRAVSGKIMLIINKIVLDALNFCFINSYVLLLPWHTGIKFCHIFHFLPGFFRNAQVFRQDNPDVKFFLIQIFRQRADNICQASCFHKGISLGCCKEYFSHMKTSKLFPAPRAGLLLSHCRNVHSSTR